MKTKITNTIRDKYLKEVDDIALQMSKYLKNFNKEKFYKVFEFAEKAHEGQFRIDGSPYITHPIAVTKILVSFHADEASIAASLLHDVPEDTERTLEDIAKNFGKTIAFLVEGLTKLSKVHYQHDMQKRQIESLKRLFIHTAKDPRIIVIKLSDRIHNMRTLFNHPKPEKRLRIAKETLEIYVPVAHLIGIEVIKNELELLCFQHIYNEDYKLIENNVDLTLEKNSKAITDTIKHIETQLKKEKPNTLIYRRERNLFSIYKKIASEMNRLEDFENLISIRIILDDISSCYTALGILHNLYKPKPKKFKDYIAVPKKNGYQSLHTTLFGQDGTVLEVQILTNEMLVNADYGIVASYFNSDAKNVKLKNSNDVWWASKIDQISDLAIKENDSFLSELKLDLLHDRIFVFTPKGDVIDLPTEATCIDFAYEIHTEVGHRAINAEIDGKIIPMNTKLHHGDTVNIITSDISKSPNRSWLAFVKTNSAKQKILDYFRKVSTQEKAKMGKYLLQKAMNRAGLGNVTNLSAKKLFLFCEKYKHCSKLHDVFVKIGEGLLNPVDVINFIYPQCKKNKKKRLFFRKKYIKEGVSVTVRITSEDKMGQLVRIMNVFSEFKVDAFKLKATKSYFTDNEFVCYVSVNMEDFNQISTLFENLEEVEGIKKVERVVWKIKFQFILASLVTFLFWASHPFFVHFLTLEWIYAKQNPWASHISLYFGAFMLFFMVFFIKRVAYRAFPEVAETNIFWGITLAMMMFAIFTIIAEIYLFKIQFNLIAGVVLILLSFLYLIYSYISLKKDVDLTI